MLTIKSVILLLSCLTLTGNARRVRTGSSQNADAVKPPAETLAESLLSPKQEKVSAFNPAGVGARHRSAARSRVHKTFKSKVQMLSDEFSLAVVGDLHLDPRKMEDYESGRKHWVKILDDAKGKHGNAALMSLGDLGESKSIRPEETSELFAGTTECHRLASEFLGSFGVPYEVIGGNHDLEGLDEFATDEENLEVFLREHGKPHAHFMREIADKTLCVGLGSTVFRDAKYTSHEVTVDDDQIAWFEKVLEDHPSTEGWKIFVFTHAPPNGSGLRVDRKSVV